MNNRQKNINQLRDKTDRGNIVPTSENKACLCFYNECSRYSTELKRKGKDEKVKTSERNELEPSFKQRTFHISHLTFQLKEKPHFPFNHGAWRFLFFLPHAPLKN